MVRGGKYSTTTTLDPDGIVSVGLARVGVEGFGAAADGHHHLSRVTAGRSLL